MRPARRETPSPPIALLTDFGTADHYGGAMRGVILGINPAAQIVDISHAVQPHHIRQGAYLLWAAYRSFPAGTIFVAVVDPGVGSDRRILLVEANKQVFLAPENGLLDLVLASESGWQAYAVDIRTSPFLAPPLSSTFHGRDVFAPLAAHLSLGARVERIGKPVLVHPPRGVFVSGLTERRSHARVLHIDRFGNVITNVRGLERVIRKMDHIQVKRMAVAQWIRTYAEAPARRPCLIVGSSGLVEIVVRERSAAATLGIDLDTRLTLVAKHGNR